ncbi:glycosyltransferase [Saccharospirillum sp. HFRX-1]|uniref:glycosyltransferase n=1 Tax=unclassified Saccharospirillum TaxID=2633430 RepID=UPI00372446BD
MSRALIFRKDLLPYSETFIAEQAHHLPSWEPIFCGFKRNMAGYNLIEQKSVPGKEYHVCIESDFSQFPKLTAGLHKKLNILNKRWLRQLTELSPQIIHAHFGSNALNCLALSKALNIPLLTTFHGRDITINKHTKKQDDNLQKVFNGSQKIIAVSDFIKSKLLERGCPENKIIQHYIGVNTQKFKPSGNDAIEGRIVFVGRLVEKKGCEYLIKALQKIGIKDNIQLNIIGDGPLMNSLKELSNEAPCNINFMGRLSPDQIVEEVQSAQLLCAPSITASTGDQEGLPISILEALSCGTPVIGTYSAGIAEAVIDGTNGFLVQEKDIDAIASRIHQVLNDKNLRTELSVNARQTATTKFDLDKQSSLLEEIYCGL